MGTCIEIASSAIRCCRVEDGHLIGLDAWSRDSDNAPAESLGAINLPPQLGPVRVILDHNDMLLRCLLQPLAPRERLERTIRFEIDALLGDLSEETLADWTILDAGGIDDTRVVVLCVKRSLLDGLQAALASHGATLQHLTHPALALYHAYRQSFGHTEENAVLLDCGGNSLHSALVEQGHLLFLRSQSPGFNGLANDVAERRGLNLPQAHELLTSLTNEAPDDLLELVQRSAITLGTNITNNLRFAQAQLKMTAQPQIDAVYLAGAAARLPGLVDTLGKRLRLPIRILNPFAGLLSDLPTIDLDRLAELPSPFTLVCAGAQSEHFELDALNPMRIERRNHFLTSGVLRLAAVASVLLLGLTLAHVFWQDSRQAQAMEDIGIDRAGGLVAHAETVHDQLATAGQAIKEQQTHLAFLAGERRAGRITGEFLAVIAEIQDAEQCPVQLTSYQVNRDRRGPTLVEIYGNASAVGNRSTSDVLNHFEAELHRRYPLFDRIENLSVDGSITSAARQVFAYRFSFPDRARTEAP